MKKIIFILLLGCVLFSGCTDNTRAKTFGGTMTIEIPVDRQFVNVTWKEAQMWVVTTIREPGHKPQKYFFKEKSNFGMLEGTVIFEEK